MQSKSSQTLSGLMIVSIPLAAILIFVWKSLFWGWVYDDAYIAFRFSDNWATGNGLTWNPGEDPVEGFTSFAWVLIGAFIQRIFTTPPHVSMIVVSIISWIVLVTFLLPKMIEAVVYSSDRDNDISSKLLGGLTLLTLLLNPYLGFNTFHGLETAFHILFFAVATYFALQDPTTKNVVGLVVASFISVMIRPDALAFVFPLWSVLIVYSVSGNQRRKVIAGFLALSIALGIYSLLKWWWFGYPFPNTFYIKQGGLLPGLGYVRSYFDVLSLVWFFLVFALGRVGISKLVRDKKFVLLLLPAIVFCLAYVGLKPTLGQGYRFLIPTLPLIILACLRAYTLSEKQSIQNVLGRWNMSRFISEVFAIYSLVMLLLIAFFGYKMYRGYKGLQNYFGSISQTLVPLGIT